MPPIAVNYKLCLYQGNTGQVLVNGLQDNDGNFLNAASLTATLLDENRTVVAQCQNIALAYVAASNGDYLGTIPTPFTAIAGTEYTMIIDGDSGASSHFHVEMPTEVKVRVN